MLLLLMFLPLIFFAAVTTWSATAGPVNAITSAVMATIIAADGRLGAKRFLILTGTSCCGRRKAADGGGRDGGGAAGRPTAVRGRRPATPAPSPRRPAASRPRRGRAWR